MTVKRAFSRPTDGPGATGRGMAVTGKRSLNE